MSCRLTTVVQGHLAVVQGNYDSICIVEDQKSDHKPHCHFDIGIHTLIGSPDNHPKPQSISLPLPCCQKLQKGIYSNGLINSLLVLKILALLSKSFIKNPYAFFHLIQSHFIKLRNKSSISSPWGLAQVLVRDDLQDNGLCLGYVKSSILWNVTLNLHKEMELALIKPNDKLTSTQWIHLKQKVDIRARFRNKKCIYTCG